MKARIIICRKTVGPTQISYSLGSLISVSFLFFIIYNGCMALRDIGVDIGIYISGYFPQYLTKPCPLQTLYTNAFLWNSPTPLHTPVTLFVLVCAYVLSCQATDRFYFCDTFHCFQWLCYVQYNIHDVIWCCCYYHRYYTITSPFARACARTPVPLALALDWDRGKLHKYVGLLEDL